MNFHATTAAVRPPLDALADNGFIRQKPLIASGLAPFSVTTLWRKVQAGTFPKPIKLSGQITAWRVSDIKEWAKDPAGYAATSQTEAQQ